LQGGVVSSRANQHCKEAIINDNIEGDPFIIASSLQSVSRKFEAALKSQPSIYHAKVHEYLAADERGHRYTNSYSLHVFGEK